MIQLLTKFVKDEDTEEQHSFESSKKHDSQNYTSNQGKKESDFQELTVTMHPKIISPNKNSGKENDFPDYNTVPRRKNVKDGKASRSRNRKVRKHLQVKNARKQMQDKNVRKKLRESINRSKDAAVPETCTIKRNVTLDDVKENRIPEDLYKIAPEVSGFAYLITIM